MKLKYEFVTMDMGDGKLSAVPVGEGAENFHGMLILDELSAAVLDKLKQDTTPQDIHNYLKDKFPETADNEIAAELVPFINKLSAAGLLITP